MCSIDLTKETAPVEGDRAFSSRDHNSCTKNKPPLVQYVISSIHDIDF